MKSLVVYYSYSGNTRLIAETVAHALDADIEELQPVKPLHAMSCGDCGSLSVKVNHL